MRGRVRSSSDGVTLVANEQGCAERLARFFPRAPFLFESRCGSPHCAGWERSLAGSNRGGSLGGAEHAIFLSSLPSRVRRPGYALNVTRTVARQMQK